MNVLILAAGGPVSDPARGEHPLWLSEIEGGSLLVERVIEAYRQFNPTHFVFAVRQHDVRTHHVDAILRLIVPECGLVELKKETQGAACTALLAIDKIDLDAELIVANVTDMVEVDLRDVVGHFRREQAAAGTIVFDSLHPRYSFVRLNGEGEVTEAAEKRPISRNAVAGFFWLAKAREFVDAAKAVILKDGHVNGQFYVAPSLNEFVLRQRKVLAWKIKADQYHPLKSAQQVNTYEAALDDAKVLP